MYWKIRWQEKQVLLDYQEEILLVDWIFTVVLVVQETQTFGGSDSGPLFQLHCLLGEFLQGCRHHEVEGDIPWSQEFENDCLG